MTIYSRPYFFAVILVALSASAAEPELKTTLSGHTKDVLSVAFSFDGKTLASGSADKTIKLWDVASGKNLATLEGHSDEVTCVRFAPDDKMIASGSNDGTIRLWDKASGKTITRIIAHENAVRTIAFSPDGKTLASGNWGEGVKLWDLAIGTNTAMYKGFGCTSSLAFSPDGKTLASGHVSMDVAFWNVSTGKLSSAHYDDNEDQNLAVRSIVAFLPDGKTLIWGNNAVETLTVLNVTSGKKIIDLKDRGVEAVSYSLERKALSSANYSGEIKVWDDTSKMIASFKDKNRFNCSAFSADGKTLAIGVLDDDKKPNGSIKVWNLEKFYGMQK